MRTSFPLVAALLTAACWTAVAHAQADAASAAASMSADAPTSSQASAPDSLSAAQRKEADRKLQRRVGAALARTRELNATRILVRARDGQVTLTGSVMETSQASLAAAVARRVAGVASVSNQLRIDGPAL
ncbi:BON domain-containing protein [Burkholderia sp. FERM BP-3421]|uniref:BON domain-containing protein n=1 Tax=Burkholderia sp. FERM BP-3421 TaxID=1494466 RepID=UPI00235E44C2|nr:BON domain-containing protein [Burkholderia sp. FERM BP-3421]WDD93497.1 BON domain-containing protein [Burkholderia sp. FERM BP-3421]